MNHHKTTRSTIYTENITQHISLESIPILIITWNVNGHVETNLQSLKDQLLFPKSNYSSFNEDDAPEILLDPQIIIIGFQELIELSTTNVIGNAVNTGQDTLDKLNYWEEIIDTCLQEMNDEFELLERHCMVGLGLLIFTWRGLKRLIEHVQIAELPRGVGGVLGNKGAIYIRMEIFDTSICIINSHFAAHRDKLKKRNQDYYAILHFPAFPDVSLTKSQQLLQQHHQNQIDTIKVAQAKGLITNVKKKLQNYYQIYGNQPTSPTSSLKQTQTNPSMPTTVPVTIVNPVSSQNSSSNRVTSYSSNKSSSGGYSYPILDDSEESDNDTTCTPSCNSRGASLHGSTSTTTAINQLGFSIPNKTADDHDIILWLGDLNYRIVSSIDINTVYSMIQNNDCMTLLTYDQLNQEKEKNNIFQGFNEGLLTFPPTYQYIPGKDIYDNRKDAKKRCPAWCDRILWRIGKHQTNTMILEELTTRRRHRLSKVDSRKNLLKKSQDQTEVANVQVESAHTTPAGGTSNPFVSAYNIVKRTLTGKESSSHSGSSSSTASDDEDIDETDVERGKAKQSLKAEAVMTLQSSSIDDMISLNSKSQDSGSIITDMKPEKTNVSQLVIREEDEEEDQDDEEGEEALGIGEYEEEDEEDDDSSANEEEEENDNDANLNRNRRRRLSTKEITQIKQIAQQLLKKSVKSSPRGSISSPINYPRSTHSSNYSHAANTIFLKSNSVDPDFMQNSNVDLADNRDPTIITPPHVPSGRVDSLDEGMALPIDNSSPFTGDLDDRSISTTSDSTKRRVSRAFKELENQLQKNSLQDKEEEEDKERQKQLNLEELEKEEEEAEGETGQRESHYNRLREVVELMSYDRCPHNLSDHKAVRAFINLKVKRVNWKENERSLIQTYGPYVKDIPHSYHPTNNLFHHLYEIQHFHNINELMNNNNNNNTNNYNSTSVLSGSPGRRSAKNEPTTPGNNTLTLSNSTAPGGNVNTNTFHFTSQRWILASPSIVSLKSITHNGDSSTIDLMNYSDNYYVKLNFLKETIPDWIHITNANRSYLDDIILPNGKVPYNFENDHMKSTLRLVDLVEEYKPYSAEKLPKLGKFLNVPSNNPKMEIYGVVTILVQWYANPPKPSNGNPVNSNNANFAADSSNNARNPVIYEEHLHIPVLCSLCI